MPSRIPPSATASQKTICLLLVTASMAQAALITTDGKPGQLDIREAGAVGVRISLMPADLDGRIPLTPMLVEREEPEPVISLREIGGAVSAQIGELRVTVTPEPLTVHVTKATGEPIQKVVFHEDGSLEFQLDDAPVLGLGEGGPQPARGVDWRTLPVEFDRRGRLHQMRPRWQSNAYGSRNPVPLLVGTGGWGLYVAAPWGEIDLSGDATGSFRPVEIENAEGVRQSQENQHDNLGKGMPPLDAVVPGLLDVFVFDTSEPAAFLRDIATISGPAAMPPRWALGYMQSHRTLEDDTQMIEIVDTFREKQIPLDAVIYLGTGFTPRGWNTRQPSFDFNPEVFTRDPEAVINDLHDRNVNVAVHMVPWDRDRLPVLHGTIPPAEGETLDAGHIVDYWQEHVPLVKSGIDAWWPDEGDWFDLYERIKRHQMYYQGPLSTTPNKRPWSLHRNGYLGIAQWGGWVWSGDTDSTWKSLEAQIAVGINHSLSLSPFWGSDIGGFFPTTELTGELYTRWFQFGAFTPSFRSHGRTWWTRLPWGWGLTERGPLESNTPPLESSMNDETVEPIAKQYAELRYQLLSYNYTLAWEAHETGLPMMRAMWLHYPKDEHARGLGNQYLWGRDLLIAPVFEKGASSRDVYLPTGEWYDWWTNEKYSGQQTLTREVDLATMPIYVKAGTILPIDPIRQYTGQVVDEPLTLRIFTGADGSYTLYEDDGVTLDYLSGESTRTRFEWNDRTSTLVIEPDADSVATERAFKVQLIPERSAMVTVIRR